MKMIVEGAKRSAKSGRNAVRLYHLPLMVTSVSKTRQGYRSNTNGWINLWLR